MGRPHCSLPYLPSDQALPRAGPSLGVPSFPDQGRPLNPKDSLQAGPQPSLHTGIPEAGPGFLSLQSPPPHPHISPQDPWGRLPAFVPHRHSGDRLPPSSSGLTLHRNPAGRCLFPLGSLLTGILEAGPQTPLHQHLQSQLLTGALSRTHPPCHSSQSLAGRPQHLSPLRDSRVPAETPPLLRDPSCSAHSSTEPGSLLEPLNSFPRSGP